MKISVIITARNNGKYLAEAIESCLRQTVTLHDIVYSDDFSTDNSISVARKYKEVTIIEHAFHVGVVEARNNGADAAKGDAFVFLDGDDVLPDNFIEKHLQVFDESTPFVYCSAQTFGMTNVFWKVYAWKTLFLWDRNFVNTSLMVWRDAFIKSGKWQETCVKTMWDWSLAIRLSRLGIPRKSPAILLYRQHSQSWSQTKEKKNNYSDFLKLTEDIRDEMVNVTVGLVYDGRIKGFMVKWMTSLISDISILKNKPQFIIVNNSQENLSFLKSVYGKYFSEIKIITGQGKLSWDNEVDRRNKVCELLSECYNMILENATGELIHLRENDIIPNKGSFRKIYDLIIKGNPVKNAVAGVYMNRNPNFVKIVGGFYNENDPQKTIDMTRIPAKEPFVVDYTGTGFLLFWKDICPIFSPYIDRIQAHDWAWGMKLKRQGGALWMNPNSICRHYTSMDEYVEYTPDMDILPSNTFTRKMSEELVQNKSIIIKHKTVCQI